MRNVGIRVHNPFVKKNKQNWNTTSKATSKIKIFSYLEDLFETDIPTELKAFECLKNSRVNLDVNYLAVPWTVLINTKKLDLAPNIQLDGGFTICQHVNFKLIIPKLKEIGIDVLFTPHVMKKDIFDGIHVLPFPHFPINGADPASNKDLLYSFIGYDTHFTRKQLFSLPAQENTIIKQRLQWHFKGNQQLKDEERGEYQEVLSRSRYSLCPRGVGASTVRFWESLQAEAIPVLFDRDMYLPEGFDWTTCCIFLNDKDIINLHAILSAIPEDRENELKSACKAAFNQFCGEGFVFAIYNYYGVKNEYE